MNQKKTDPSILLNRAYSLRSTSETKALYRDWAETYDDAMLDGLAYTTPRDTARLLREFVKESNAQVLDVGSGTGLAGLELERLGFTCIDALDYSADMLRQASKRGIYGKLIEADLNKPLELPEASYDAIICTGTFTHAHVGASCLGELFRILRPGGHFACTVHFDVWEPAGFEEKVKSLKASDLLKVRHFQPGTYFETSDSDEGWFIVWQKQGENSR